MLRGEFERGGRACYVRELSEGDGLLPMASSALLRGEFGVLLGEFGLLRGETTEEFRLLRSETTEEFRLLRSETSKEFRLLRTERRESVGVMERKIERLGAKIDANAAAHDANLNEVGGQVAGLDARMSRVEGYLEAVTLGEWPLASGH